MNTGLKQAPKHPDRPNIPRLLVLTDRVQSENAGRTLVDTVVAAVSAGAPAVLLREKDLSHEKRRALAEALLAVTHGHGAQLLIASDVDLAKEAGADGVHLAAGDPTVTRNNGGTDEMLVARSCHNPTEVAAAVADNVDYITLSPIAPTSSKPGHGPALGPEKFAEIAAATGEVEVLALGGVTPDNVASFCTAGAYGVAVMSAVMRAPDAAAVVSRLLAAIPADGF